MRGTRPCHDELYILSWAENKKDYYSFKIFLRFWLARITCVIHNYQLLFTKFGRILPYWTNDVKSAEKWQIIEPLAEKTWGRDRVLFEVSNGGTFYSFHDELLSKNIARTARRQLDGRKLLFGDICRPEQLFIFISHLSPKHPDKDALYLIWTNIDGGKHVLAYYYFWINNKAIIEFGFRRIGRIMQIEEGLIHRGRLNTPNWSQPPLFICTALKNCYRMVLITRNTRQDQFLSIV